MQKRSKVTWYLMLFFFFLVSCTSTKVTSVKDEDYSGNLDNILVITDFSEDMERFEERFIESIKMIYTLNGYKIFFSREATGKLNSTHPWDKAKKHGAIAALVIEERSYSRTDNAFGMGTGTKKKYNFEVEIFDVQLEKKVWEADVETKGEEYTGPKKEARVMTEELINKLVADGLLSRNTILEKD